MTLCEIIEMKISMEFLLPKSNVPLQRWSNCNSIITVTVGLFPMQTFPPTMVHPPWTLERDAELRMIIASKQLDKQII